MADVRFAVKRYIGEGWSVIPIPRGSKAPTEKDWVNRTFDESHFSEDSNVGVRLGRPSGNLVDVDLDVPEAVVAAKTLLLHTERIHGRPGTGASHYWYIADVKSMRWQDVDGKVLCEVRSTGGQTVLPPSIHPSGETLYWEHDRAPAAVDPKGLVRSALLVATAALLARHWPKGSRHVCAKDAAGFLAARDLDPREIEEIIKAAATAAGDDEIEDRVRVARDTAKQFASGGKTTGGPNLAAAIGKEVVDQLSKWYGGNGSIFDGLVEEMNRRHFYTMVGSSTVVGTERDDEILFQRERDLYSWYANQQIVVGSRQITKGPRKGEIEDVRRSKFEIWREHPKRRQYRAITFAPPPRSAHPEDFNTWTGLAVEPDPNPNPAERCGLYLAHVRDNLCRGNDDYFEYLLNLMAFTVQQPGIPSEISVALKGQQGTGKGVFVRNFGGIFGRHFVQLDKPDHVVGRFNASIASKVVVFADEAFFAGDRSSQGAMKRLITEPQIQIERKHVDPVVEPNCIHLFMASNDDFISRADLNERRYFVLNVSDAHMQDLPYFQKIQDQMDHGGREALLALLLARQVTHEEVRRVPRTEELRTQQELTLSPEMAWWKERLLDGEIALNEPWPSTVCVNELHADYMRFCDGLKINRRVSKYHFSRLVLDPWLFDEERETGGSRRRFWRLKPLAEARALFDQRAGVSTPWPEEEPGQPNLPAGGDRAPF